MGRLSKLTKEERMMVYCEMGMHLKNIHESYLVRFDDNTLICTNCKMPVYKKFKEGEVYRSMSPEEYERIIKSKCSNRKKQENVISNILEKAEKLNESLKGGFYYGK